MTKPKATPKIKSKVPDVCLISMSTKSFTEISESDESFYIYKIYLLNNI